MRVLRAVGPVVSHRWGVIPVRARGDVLPVKDVMRHAEGLTLGDVVSVEMAIKT